MVKALPQKKLSTLSIIYKNNGRTFKNYGALERCVSIWINVIYAIVILAYFQKTNELEMVIYVMIAWNDLALANLR